MRRGFAQLGLFDGAWGLAARLCGFTDALCTAGIATDRDQSGWAPRSSDFISRSPKFPLHLVSDPPSILRTLPPSAQPHHSRVLPPDESLPHLHPFPTILFFLPLLPLPLP